MLGITGREWLAFLALGCFLTLWLVEWVAPFSRRTGRMRHAVRNLVMAGVNALALALFLSGLTVSAAHVTEARGWGLLNGFSLPLAAKVALAILVLDVWTYWWHRANHRVALLWRFHRMHHSDTEMDVTTATRFHLGEITLSTIARLAIIPLAGIPLTAIVVYELVLLLATQFHHANIALPGGTDRVLRLAVVSPNMHRVHHSVNRIETDSNYSSVLSIWDRVFGSYRERRDVGQIRFGVEGFSEESSQSLAGLLLTPLAVPGVRREHKPAGARQRG